MNDARERETQAAAESSHGSKVTSGTGLPRDPEKSEPAAQAKLGDESSSLARVLHSNDRLSEDPIVRQPRTLDDRYRRVTVSEITTPRQGRICYVDHWWHVTENDEVLFWRVRGSYGTPQCNTDKRVVDYLPIEGCTPRLIPVAYLPHNCHDYA